MCVMIVFPNVDEYIFPTWSQLYVPKMLRIITSRMLANIIFQNTSDLNYLKNKNKRYDSPKRKYVIFIQKNIINIIAMVKNVFDTYS